MKTHLFGIFGLLITGSALADTTSPTPIHDEPGFFVHLDIDKIVSRTDLTSRCGIVPARLDYLDHSGQEHVLDYLVHGYGCQNDN